MIASSFSEQTMHACAWLLDSEFGNVAEHPQLSNPDTKEMFPVNS
jgi:hypothetical protein